MGLDADFLGLLTASIQYESVHDNPDLFGNDEYDSPVTAKAYIENIVQEFGQGQEGREQESRIARVATVYTDAVGIKQADRLTIGTDAFWVRSVNTYKDEFGADLFQEIQAVDQKE